MSGSITFTFPVNAETLAAVLAVLGVPSTGVASVPTASPVPAPEPPAPGANAAPRAGSFMNPAGLAVLDAAGAAVVADRRHASEQTINALQRLAANPNVTQEELLRVVGSGTLAGNKAATTKRVEAAIGARTGAVLYRIENGVAVMAEETRRALARHFGFES